MDEKSWSLHTISFDVVFLDVLWQTSSHGEPGDVLSPITAEVRQLSTMKAEAQIVVDLELWPSIVILIAIVCTI